MRRTGADGTVEERNDHARRRTAAKAQCMGFVLRRKGARRSRRPPSSGVGLAAPNGDRRRRGEMRAAQRR